MASISGIASKIFLGVTAPVPQNIASFAELGAALEITGVEGERLWRMLTETGHAWKWPPIQMDRGEVLRWDEDYRAEELPRRAISFGGPQA